MQVYTLEEIKAKITSNDYNAEMLLQHAMSLLDAAPQAKPLDDPRPLLRRPHRRPGGEAVNTKTCFTCKHYDVTQQAARCHDCGPYQLWEPAAPAPTGEPVAVVKTVVGAGENAVRVRWLRGFPQIGSKLYLAPPSTAALEAEVERLRAEITMRIEEAAAACNYAVKVTAERDEALRVARGALERIADDGIERSRDPRTLIAIDALSRINALEGTHHD